MRERAHRLIALAAPPGERLGPWFTPVFTDTEVLAERAARWCAAAANGDPDRFTQCLEAAGVPASALDLALSDVALRPEGDLPPWGEALIELLEALSTARDDQERDSLPDRLLRQCRWVGRRALDGIRDHSPVPLSPSALDDLAMQFARRVMSTCARAIDFDLRIEESVVGLARTGAIPMPDLQKQPSIVDQWLCRFERHPALAYAVGVCYANWTSGTREMLDRLRVDEVPLVLGEATITSVQSDAGDVHSHGRSVAILGLDDGRRIVYKPKSLASAVAFFDLVDLVAEEGLRVTMPRHNVVDAGEYGWEEFVPAKDCEGPVGDFYYRLGALLRLLQFVEARDIWLDNVLASGDVPVLIDLETIMQPRLPDRVGTSRAECAARERVEESAATMGLLSAAVPIRPGLPAEDLGVLTPPRVFRMPFRPAVDALQAAGAGVGLDADGFLEWTGPTYFPTVAGRPADARAHLPSFMDGYRAADERLYALAERLLTPGSPLQLFAGLRVRHIMRDTWTYYEVMHASLAPGCLRDGLDREIALSRLFRSPSPKRLVAAEIAALRDLDVPTFYASASKDHLVFADGSTLPGFFQGTSFDRLLRRVGTRTDLDEQVALIGTALACGSLGREPAGEATLPVVVSRSTRHEMDWVAHAVDIGDEILGHALVDGRGEPALVGITYDPRHDMSAVGVLGPDLMNGLGGLAILYADLARVTGLHRFATAAERLVGAVRRRLPQEGPVAARGGMVGVGSALYTLGRCAGTLQDAELGAVVADLACRVTIDRDATDDIVCGCSGLLLALERAAAAGPISSGPAASLQTEALVASLATRLEQGALTSATPPGAHRLLAVPDLVEAVSLALARATGQAYPPASGGTPALSEARTLSAGAALARIARGSVDEEVLASVSAALAEARGGRMAKTLDAVELQLAMGAFDEAADTARLLVGRREAAGRWFPGSYAADHHLLSVVDGLPAIAHALLRVHAPEIPSVRLLA